jgi:hypothetical protein
MDNLSQFKSAIYAGMLIVITLFITQIMLVRVSPLIPKGQKLYEYFVISLFSTIGITIGWFLGVISSPNATQNTQFAAVSSAFASFFSGFLVSKLNDGWQKLLTSGTGRSIFIIRLALALAWLVVAFTLTFLTRSFHP